MPNISEALIGSKSTEVNHDGKLQMDLQVIITDFSEDWNLKESESSEYSECIKIKISEFQKSLSMPKLIIPTPTFSANYLLIEPKIGLLTSVPSQKLPELPFQRGIKSVPASIADLEHVEKKCFETMADIKSTKPLKNKLEYNTGSSSLFDDSKLRELEKLLASNSKKEVRQSKKGKYEAMVGFFIEALTETLTLLLSIN